MNRLKQLYCKYFTQNRTLETLLVSNNINEYVFYIYNYKGTSYRLFTSEPELKSFFKGQESKFIHFHDENTLDQFLLLQVL